MLSIRIFGLLQTCFKKRIEPIKSNFRIERDLGSVVRKLDSIDRKLTELSARMSRIEKAVGKVEPKPPVKRKIPSQSPDEKIRKERSPSS